MPEHFLHMPEHAQTCLYKPVHACTTEELLLRSTSHCVIDTYIAGYAPPSLFG
jgi:hypothetical protein